jgi:hypothetical protein
MIIYDATLVEQETIAEFYRAINSIPVGHKADITLTINEYNIMKRHLNFKDGLFSPIPTYRGVKIFRTPCAK